MSAKKAVTGVQIAYRQTAADLRILRQVAKKRSESSNPPKKEVKAQSRAK